MYNLTIISPLEYPMWRSFFSNNKPSPTQSISPAEDIELLHRINDTDVLYINALINQYELDKEAKLPTDFLEYINSRDNPAGFFEKTFKDYISNVLLHKNRSGKLNNLPKDEHESYAKELWEKITQERQHLTHHRPSSR